VNDEQNTEGSGKDKNLFKRLPADQRQKAQKLKDQFEAGLSDFGKRDPDKLSEEKKPDQQ
jgi:hypothetical protein